jgi:YVTN family beta-propeller protein
MRAKSTILMAALLCAAVLASAETLVTVTLRIFPSRCALAVDGGAAMPYPRAGGAGAALHLRPGPHELAITAPGYRERKIALSLSADQVLEAKLEREDTGLHFVDFVATGSQPKSVAYTPDGRFIVSALLDGPGVEVVPRGGADRFTACPPMPWAAQRGFVEVAFFPSRGEMWVSQMSTGMIHVFRLTDFSWLDCFSTRGAYPKIIARTADEATAFVSNWESHDISVIDAAARTVVARIRVGGVPRGMALSRDELFLYACLFDSGSIAKIDLKKRGVVKTLDFGSAAMRHIVLHPLRDIFYVSDMLNGRVLAIDAATDRLAAQIRVDRTLNTIALSPDGTRLFVSSRGPNNMQDYTRKGPEFGKVYCIDTGTMTITDWAWGGNQPTGLAVAPDGKSFAFSDFLDDRLELYCLEGAAAGSN